MDAARGALCGIAMDGSGAGSECALRSGGPAGPAASAGAAVSGDAAGAEFATCTGRDGHMGRVRALMNLTDEKFKLIPTNAFRAIP